jgi:hypothetical protein
MAPSRHHRSQLLSRKTRKHRMRTIYFASSVESAVKRALGGPKLFQVAPQTGAIPPGILASIGRRRSQLAPVTLSNKRKNHETA